MFVLLLVIHIMLAFALVGVILIQKSEGGALGMGGGGMSGFMTGRSTANLLTRTTAIIAACFMLTSVLLVVLSSHGHTPSSIIDQSIPAIPTTAPAPTSRTVPAPQSPAPPRIPAPEAPAAPSAPAPATAPSTPVTPPATNAPLGQSPAPHTAPAGSSPTAPSAPSGH
jgi:preprotein translocase subunit SecG